jgi:hypothetical protein
VNFAAAIPTSFGCELRYQTKSLRMLQHAPYD